VSFGGADDSAARLELELFNNDAIYPQDWKVSGLERNTAQEVARLPDGSLVYGGTPSDISLWTPLSPQRERGCSPLSDPKGVGSNRKY
jgi:hypothetical protein